jgi:putative transposase
VSPVAQCDLLGLSRSRWYERASAPSAPNVDLMRRPDEEYTAPPFYGSRRMTAVLRRSGYAVNRKRVRRLVQQMGWRRSTPNRRCRAPTPITASTRTYCEG